ncbi:glycosyltransferase family 4 protein [Butyrivibrio fibrisolvens]|uniref:glycosyltransferase family 4 protein n=1 Tax=Butyrivibrio fibrisolvens TaxID=831 RepID=UPI000400633B|nr:glycosyltransferase family 4 protein [Butyrivibrio fibrisolvens]
MKVLFLANIPSPYRVEFFNLLSQQCDLTVVYERRIASDREDDWYIDTETKYKVHFLKGIDYSNDASIAPGVVNFLCKGKYDIIVVSGYSSVTQMLTIMTLKMRHIPYILNVDGGMIKKESKFKYWYKKKLVSGASAYLSTGRECDKFLVHYGAEEDKLRRYPFTSIRKSDIIPKVLSAEEKRAYKEKINCNYKKMILSVGQPIHRKGFDILIKAVAKLNISDLGVYIVGGEPNDECAELVKELKTSNIHFVPFMKKAVLADYYKAADLFVFPTREDIWGLVINEAMSYGLPIVTTDKCNAGLELVKSGNNGYIIQSEDVEKLSKVISNILTIDSIETLEQNSLNRIKSYTFENMVTEHIKIFEDMIQSQER